MCTVRNLFSQCLVDEGLEQMSRRWLGPRPVGLLEVKFGGAVRIGKGLLDL